MKPIPATHETGTMAPSPMAAISRRRLLQGAAGVGLAGAALPSVAAQGDPELSVMTRNLYVGVDLSRLFGVEDLKELRAVAGDIRDDIRAHPYEARANALAAEIEATDPGVVCVQEAALVRTRDPSQFDGDHDPGAEDVRVDLLELLSARLEASGLEYAVADSLVTNDIEVPADTDDGTVDLRLTNRIAVLVREDVDVSETRSDRFDSGVPIPLERVDLTIRRGYAAADVAIEGRPVTVASTHLESFVAAIRDTQAEELRAALPDDRPVVVAGDLNVGPETSPDTYDRLREDFDDAYATLRPASDGPTCCHDDDLRNETPNLTRRVDAVLHRGGTQASAVDRVGASPADRVEAELGDESVRVWPSDHAGVVAALTVPPAPVDPTHDSPTSTSPPSPSATAPPTESSGTSAGTPGGDAEPQGGFGLATAVLAGVGAVLAALRRRGGDEG